MRDRNEERVRNKQANTDMETEEEYYEMERERNKEGR
jgi:hypothetical protein